MSHTITNQRPANVTLIQTFTIINYLNGTGETFTLAENGLVAGTSVIPVFMPSQNNSLGVNITPIVVGSALRLYQEVAGVLTEIPTTNGLNAVFNSALICAGAQISSTP